MSTVTLKKRHPLAGYMLALKDNQKLPLEGVAELFETKFKDRETRFKECSRTDKRHGRVTTRTCCHTDYPEWMSEKDRDGCAVRYFGTIRHMSQQTRDKIDYIVTCVNEFFSRPRA